jgi:hypothetical protein
VLEKQGFPSSKETVLVCREKKIDEMIVQKWVGHAIGSRMTKAVYTLISDDKELDCINQMNGTDKVKIAS